MAQLEPIYELGTDKILYYMDVVSSEKYYPISETSLHIQDGYEFRDENNNVINTKQITLTKKKPQYPKIYSECCRIVNASPYVTLVDDISEGQKYSHDVDNLQIHNNLRKLKICRDAYWKIAGEKMNLSKPWEPDWCDEHTIKYIIYICQGKINVSISIINSQFLAFPTEEMRDAFYENFKDLIENCKELL